jgi:peptidoglycan LD-endopeptidase LytH
MKLLVWILIVVVLIAGLVAWLFPRGGVSTRSRDTQVIDWIRNPGKHPEWAVKAGQRCGGAPFILPTDGFVGYLWDDSFYPGHRHQGIDVFGSVQPGETPVFAAADGYLSRLSDWKSSLIIRVPQDPLQSNRQIWLYYTHMADRDGNSFITADFPPGTSEAFVAAGTLLGFQGNYSGTPGSPVGVHLHFSIVKDNGQGSYLNELNIDNTLDPSPYLGLRLNAHSNRNEIPLCPE